MGALHAAARDGQHGKAAELVGKGTDVNQTDGLKYTPLHYAARKGVLQVRVYRFPPRALGVIVNMSGATRCATKPSLRVRVPGLRASAPVATARGRC